MFDNKIMNAAFTGRKRSGKTTLAFDMAMRNGGGILIFDPKKEWRGWPGTVTDVAQIPEKIKEENEVIVFHPDPTRDTEEQIEPLVEYVMTLHGLALEKGWDKAGYHFTFLIDEAVNVSDDKHINKKVLAAIAQNRPEILSIYLTFQSPKDLHNRGKSRVDNWYVFSTSLPSDLLYLQKEIGVPEQDLSVIQELRPHEFAHFFFDGGAPKVDYNYEPQTWFRPLEYFELNAEEREEAMTRRRDEGELQDLFEDFLDFLDDKDRRDSRRRRDDDDDRDDRSRNRPRRERSFSLTGRRD